MTWASPVDPIVPSCRPCQDQRGCAHRREADLGRLPTRAELHTGRIKDLEFLGRHTQRRRLLLDRGLDCQLGCCKIRQGQRGALDIVAGPASAVDQDLPWQHRSAGVDLPRHGPLVVGEDRLTSLAEGQCQLTRPIARSSGTPASPRNPSRATSIRFSTCHLPTRQSGSSGGASGGTVDVGSGTSVGGILEGGRGCVGVGAGAGVGSGASVGGKLGGDGGRVGTGSRPQRVRIRRARWLQPGTPGDVS